MAKSITKGDWDVFPDPDKGEIVVGPVQSHSGLVRMVAVLGYDDLPDAVLIASAPGMLRVLKRWAKAMMQGRYPELQGVESETFEIVAKAEGREVW